MRVGYLTYGLDRSPGGIGRYALQLLDALAALPGGPEIVLLASESGDPHGLRGRFACHQLSGCRLLPGLLTTGNLALSQATRRLGLDLIHDPNGIAPFLGPALGAKRVTTIHDAIPFRCPQNHNRLDNWRYRLMLPLAARAADAVITDSRSAAADLHQCLGLPAAKIRAIPLAAGPTFRPATSAAIAAARARHAIPGPYLLYLGGLNGRKNVVGLLEAFARLRVQHPTLSLVLVGATQWRAAAIEATIERLELAPHVRRTGYLPDAELPPLLSGAAAFVFPSRYEGFGLPVLEAMACNTPVVCSDSSSLPEVAGEAALLVPPDDCTALAAAIARVLEEPGLAASLRAKGRAQAARFSWSATAAATFAVYRELLGAAPARAAGQREVIR